MKFWRPEHLALLEALRADDTIPALVRRATDEQLVPTEDDVRLLRAWAVALSRDPGGVRALEHRHSPAAWPDTWRRAEELGFSPRTDHHNALAFRDFYRRLAVDRAWTASERAWGRSIRAWFRLSESDYLLELGATVAGESDVDVEALVRSLLLPDITHLGAELERALKVNADTLESVDAGLAGWAWSCLSAVADTEPGEDDPSGLASAARVRAIETKSLAVSSATSRFRREIEAIPWADGDADALTAPFHWMRQVCEVVDFRESISVPALQAVIEGAWTLRKIDRDDEPVFEALLDAAEPFAADVIERLERGAAFGQGSRAADFLVFRGEAATSTSERRALFERALELSPGHRNASLLLSYEILIDVENLLDQLESNPAVMRRVPLVGDSLSQTVERAWFLCDEVEAIYPYNRRLEEYRERVAEQARRLKVDLPTPLSEDE